MIIVILTPKKSQASSMPCFSARRAFCQSPPAATSGLSPPRPSSNSLYRLPEQVATQDPLPPPHGHATPTLRGASALPNPPHSHSPPRSPFRESGRAGLGRTVKRKGENSWRRMASRSMAQKGSRERPRMQRRPATCPATVAAVHAPCAVWSPCSPSCAGHHKKRLHTCKAAGDVAWRRLSAWPQYKPR